MPSTRNPSSSRRCTMAPCFCRSTASGLMMQRVRCVVIVYSFRKQGLERPLHTKPMLFRKIFGVPGAGACVAPVSYTHLRAHETPEHLVCRLLLAKKKK